MLDLVLDNKIVSNSEKIMWLKLYQIYKDEWFAGTYVEVGELLGMSQHTARMQIMKMRKNKIITAKSEFKNGCIGSRFELIMPEKWRKK
jgi:hypothetical protein